tara:strand:+ start:3833 stop:5536 length:1704 start_codon:yes stop_codon:yes gene_type:complete
MRGTKHANDATAKRLGRQLRQLLEDPNAYLPDMTWKGRLSWGRRDPVTKTLLNLKKIVAKKDDVKWLSKRMLAKRGDPVGKAFAGSLHAAHDDEISLVGNFKSPNFGSGSFIRRGDGKQGYLAGLQNHQNLTLRMLPWEDHARKGMYFFSWENGFVCTGPNPTPPKGWLEDVLERSRFDFKHQEIEGVEVYVAGEINADDVLNSIPSTQGWVRLSFNHGPIVGIDLQSLKATKEKQSAFVHHLALSMLPPLLTSVVEIDAMWVPNGWDVNDELPEGAKEGLDKLIAGWHGLTVPEGNLTHACQRSVLDSLDFGLLIGSSWSRGDSIEQILESLENLAGNEDEKLLAAGVFLEAMNQSGEGIRIDSRGGIQEREGSIVEVMEGASLTDAVNALWEDFGLAGLDSIGIEGDEAQIIWEQQLKKPKPLKTFLKGLDSSRKKAQEKAKFPYRVGVLHGAVGAIHDLILTGLLEGPGIAERKATARHDDIDSAAAGWAWLRAANRSTGQDWHFESLARDRGGAWMEATKALLEAGKDLLDSDGSDNSSFMNALRALHTATGQQEPLPDQAKA